MSMQIELPDRIQSSSADEPQSAPATEQPVTVITPEHGWQPVNFREIWRSRELMYFLVWRNLKTRYKQSVLGGAWAILQPLATMIIFTVVLQKAAEIRGPHGESHEPPYWLYVFTGMLPWTFFANTLGIASQSVVGGSNLITKIYFPRLIIPLTSAGVPLVDLGVSLGFLVVIVLCRGILPGWGALLMPLLVLGLMVASLGLGVLFAALAVAYRDVSSVLPFMIQLWMFATPTIYMQDDSKINPLLQALLPLNPAQGFIINFRHVLLGEALDLYSLTISAVVTVVLAVVGCFYFRRVESNFADII
jgi:lipopolysaccharide transport system permease protein